MFLNEDKKEKYILVSCYNDSTEDMLLNLEELSELVKTAGGEVVGYLYQKLDKFDNKTYIGQGKVEELKLEILSKGADAIICDDELSPVQMANLERMLEVKVIDRTIIILDIFAMRAKSKESKIQIELAQLNNYYTHLKGINNLSRLGGGIGTRGPGEKKLELNRRYIRNNINNLRHELKLLKNHTITINESINRKGLFRFAIVGYTNVGKSTFFNLKTNAEVLAENKLFATLDTTTREYILPNKQKILFSDTVGFINKLPHNLIESFKTTLDDIKYADALIHIINAADKDYLKKMSLVYDILNSLDVKNKPILTIFNKIDLTDGSIIYKDPYATYSLETSFTNGFGVDRINLLIENILKINLVEYEFTLPYKEGGLLNEIRETCNVINIDYYEDGIKVKAFINEKIFNKIQKLK